MNTFVSNIIQNSEVKCSASTAAEGGRSYISKVSDDYLHKINDYTCIISKIAEYALEQPSQLAVDDDSFLLTYQEYFDISSALADYLKSINIGTEDKVVVFLDVSQHIPVALLSILMTGGVYVPIDISWPKSRIDTVLTDVSPKAIITQTLYYKRFDDLNGIDVINLDDKKYLERNSSPCSFTPPKKVDTAVIFYTSGSTGFPKGVKLSYGNIQSYIESASKAYRFTSSDIHLSIAKYSFSISLFDLLLPFYCGGSLKLRPRQQLLNSEFLVNYIKSVTCFHMGPALLESLVNYAEDKNMFFSSITHVSSGGDIVPPSLLERCKFVFPNAEIWVIYGCTEVSCMGTTWQVDRTIDTDTTYVGKPFEHVNLLLLDEKLKTVDEGEFGEIYISGAGVTKGYLNREELNNVKFTSIDGSRYYASGDLGVLARNGNIQLKGRKDFQIKINGVRIETEEIEYWLNRINSIIKSIVLGAKDKRGDLKIVAFVISDNTFDEVFIKQQLADALPSNMVPHKIYAITEMPLNTNGKLDRSALITKAEESLKESFSGISTDDKVARRLMDIWFNAGAFGAIYDDSNFFDVGGDSLGIVQLVHAINTDFKISCDFELIYAHPVFSEQLKAIKKGVFDSYVVPDSLVVPLDGKSDSTPNSIYIIPGMDGHIVSYHKFGDLLSDNWRAYGLLYPNFEGDEYDLLEDVASRLVEDILKKQKSGPYIIAGHSSGGIVGLEIARTLECMGKEVYLVLIESRIYEVSPRRPFRKLFFVYLKNKPRIIIEQFLLRQKNKFKSKSSNSNIRYKQRQALSLFGLKGAFTLKKSMLDKYKISQVNVKAILLKAKESIWWDDTRDWPVDYGFSNFVKLLSISSAPGNHVSITMDATNHKALAKIIEKEITEVILKR
ncbi:AMP-binding protein [Paraglaciecola marina]|uniref:non-ribosomal peptide synthetase family protein n=1 Tax=Paraglaciecola marina TaxID=2500157 RepID=UPI00105D06C4|nr:AMP-binding protein [Paraglaciecola marina]